MAYLWFYNNWNIIHCIYSRKQTESTDTVINVHIKHNTISNIDLNIGKDISENDYGAISIIDKNAETGYYFVKWTSDSYTFQYSHKIGKYFIKAGWLVCDAVYFNLFDNLRQWYTDWFQTTLYT